MIGRTNIIFGSGSSSGGSGGVTTVDLPTCPSSLTASPGNGKVTLTLAYSDTDFVSGVEVRYKTGSYPTSPTDGTGKTVTSAATSIEVTGLTNGTTYYFRVYLYREIDSVKYYQTDETNAKIESAPMVGVTVSGITPAIQTDSYLIIDTSGSFTMTIPDGINTTIYLVGGGCKGENASSQVGGGNGGDGGYVYSTKLNAIKNVQCSCSIGADSTTYNSPTNTSLTIDTTQYNANSGTKLNGGEGAAGADAEDGRKGTSTPYGFVGSSGGGGAIKLASSNYSYGLGGSGAGRGGTAGYNGSDATNYGCGGGGGGCYATTPKKYGAGGAGKKGCIIIAWT